MKRIVVSKRSWISLLVVLAVLGLRGWQDRQRRAPSSARPAAVSTGAVSAAAHSDPQRLTVMQWNVENLFDAKDDPANAGDDEYTTGSFRVWTDDVYRVKVARLAQAMADAKADIVFLEEVENRDVLEELAARLRTEHGRRLDHIVHREGGDHRGIDVAILSTMPPVETRWFATIEGQRDIAMAVFECGGHRLVVFGNHWKSRFGGTAETNPLRMQEARILRREVDAILARDPDACILVAGDFNDDADGPAVTEGLRSSLDAAAVLADAAGQRLCNLQGALPADQRGTFYFRTGKAWNSFDTFHVSRAMLPDAPGGVRWRVVPGSFEVLRFGKLARPDGTPNSYRRVKNAADGRWGYTDGYSDHFPVRAVLQLAGPASRSGEPARRP